jgi:DNA-binding FadR family transcriptional regulator
MTLAERVADQIRRRILLGELKPGKRLESCRAMARDAQVGVAVVREAIAQLRGEGFVQVRHGVGVFVAARPRKARALRAARRTAGRREMFELRAALEPIVAEAATRRATEAGHLELRLLLGERELERRTGNSRSFAEADMAFHRAIFRMSGNRLAAAGAELAGPVLVGHVATNADAIASDDGLHVLHARLTEAIEEGRAGLARRAARAIAAHEGERAWRPP